MILFRGDLAPLVVTGDLAPLLVGVTVRQDLSRTAVVQASLSRPGGEAARSNPTWLAALSS